MTCFSDVNSQGSSFISCRPNKAISLVTDHDLYVGWNSVFKAYREREIEGLLNVWTLELSKPMEMDLFHPMRH